ncbi:CBS domain-containing protein [Botrimarina mediterranea]|uniref:CBS domain-containing protein n=1 Tax=Botrimarina mediterranea TaxID=2528022 RepID=UPI003AF32051
MEVVASESCCSPQDTAQAAAQKMQQTGCGCAPVVEDEPSRRLVGVVTERDVCHQVATVDQRPSEILVEKIMRPATACCGVDDTVEEAKWKLDTHQATSLPVVDEAGCCCGTISSHHLGPA